MDDTNPDAITRGLFHAAGEEIVAMRRRIASLESAVAALRDHTVVNAVQSAVRSSAKGKRSTRSREREFDALRRNMLTAARVAVMASPERRVEGTLRELIEFGVFGKLTSVRKVSSLLQHTSAEAFGDLRVEGSHGADGTKVYTITVAGEAATTASRDLDADAAGRVVYKQLRDLGVTDAEIAAPGVPRDILGEIRTAVIDAARKRHPDAIVGNVMTIAKSAGFEGIAPKVIGHVLSVMSRNEKCELVVKNHSPSSVPKFGSYATWVITVRQSRRPKGKRGGK